MFLFFLLLFGSYGGSRLIGRGSGLGSSTPDDIGVDTNPNTHTNAAAGGNFDGGWLSRLGWGLGEASLEALGNSPTQSYDARVAFFGHSIPYDGMTGWLVPLDEILGPCPSVKATTSSSPPTAKRNLPAPFLPLDNAYVPSDMKFESPPPAQSNNTGCPPLCPIYAAPQRYSMLGEDLAQRDGKESIDYGDIEDEEHEVLRESHEEPQNETKYVDGYYPFPENTTWVALVLRGDCDFATKALFAQRLGASALVVGGLDDNLISMSARGSIGAGSKIYIASVFIGQSSYRNLTRLLDESDVRLELSEGEDKTEEDKDKAKGVKTILIALHGEPPWEWYTPILSLLIVLSLPSLLTLCTLFIHRLRAEQHARRERAPEDVVKSLEQRVWAGAPGVGWIGDGRGGEKEGDEPAITPGIRPSESTPLMVRSESKEGEVNTVHAYGAIGETSTSVPRQGLQRELDPKGPPTEDDQIPGQQLEPRNTFQPATTSSEAAANIVEPRSVPLATGASATQSNSDPNIPRPPWFDSQTECAICLCDFEVGDRVRVLPCGHIFHLDEVDPWLIKQRKVCPVCKYDVTNPPTSMVPASPIQPVIGLSATPSPDSSSARGTHEDVEAINPQIPRNNQQTRFRLFNIWIRTSPHRTPHEQPQQRNVESQEERGEISRNESS